MFDFQKVLNAGTEKVTIVDFTESEYMDSAGLGALLNYYVSGKRRGRSLRLVAVNYRVAELLKLTSAHTLIKTYDSVEAAEAATSSAGAFSLGSDQLKSPQIMQMENAGHSCGRGRPPPAR